MNSKLSQVWPTAAFILVLVVSGYTDIISLLRYPIAVGVDGYYYVLQVREIVSQGHLYFPTRTPLIIYLLALIASVVGDVVLAIKFGGVLLHAILTASIFAVIARLERSRWLALLGAFLAAFSGLHRHMISEFINNLGAIALLIASSWFALRAMQKKQQLFWTVLALSTFVAAAFSHKAVLPISITLVFAFLIVKPLLGRKGSPRYRLALLLVSFLLFVSPAILAAQTVFELPPWLQAELLSWPQLPLGQVAWPEKAILMMVVPAIIFFSARSPDSVRHSLVTLILCALSWWTLMFTLNPFLAFNLGWTGIAVRLSSLAYIQVALMVPGLFWLLLANRPAWAWYAATLVAPLFLFSFSAEVPSGMQPYYLFNRAQIIDQLPRHLSELEAKPLILAEHGTQFVVTFASALPSLQQPPRHTEGETIYWLLLGISPDMLAPSMITLGQSAGGSYIVLVKTDELRKIVATMTSRDKQRLFGVNRHLYQACVSAGFRQPSGECSQVP